MPTKAQLQKELDTMTVHVWNLKEERDALKDELETLKASTAAEILPLPDKDTTPPAVYMERYRKRADAAQLAAKRVMDWYAENYGRADDSDDYQKPASGVGMMLSHYFHYDGNPIILAAAYGCEDANWHGEAAMLERLYDNLTDDSQRKNLELIERPMTTSAERVTFETLSKTLTKIILNDATLWFSYSTLIAFRVGPDRYVCQNVWSSTTGKHLNMVDDGDKASRLPEKEFAALAQQLQFAAVYKPAAKGEPA